MLAVVYRGKMYMVHAQLLSHELTAGNSLQAFILVNCVYLLHIGPALYPSVLAM